MFNLKEKLAALKAKLDKMFVDGWTKAYNWGSTRLAILFTFLSTAIFLYPDEFKNLVNYVPEFYRPMFTLAAGLLIMYVRLKQPKGKNNG